MEIDKLVFRSPISLDSSFGTTPLSSDTESVLILHKTALGRYFIEWIIEDLDRYEEIGIFCHDADKVISDYDGVFSVPLQAIELLERNGFDCSYLKD